jgi:hypothetical protein
MDQALKNRLSSLDLPKGSITVDQLRYEILVAGDGTAPDREIAEWINSASDEEVIEVATA